MESMWRAMIYFARARSGILISWPQPTHQISSAEVLILAKCKRPYFDFFPTWVTRIIFSMLACCQCFHTASSAVPWLPRFQCSSSRSVQWSADIVLGREVVTLLNVILIEIQWNGSTNRKATRMKRILLKHYLVYPDEDTENVHCHSYVNCGR